MQQLTQARRPRLTRFAATLGLALLSIPASAGVVYTYTSAAFGSLPAPLAADDRLVFEFESAAPLLANSTTSLTAATRWRFSIGSYAIDSLDVGAVLLSTTIYTDGAGGPMVFCGGATKPGQLFYVNSGQSIGAMLVGTACANMNERYQGFAITGGPSGDLRGAWGSWATRQGTLDTGGGNTVPEPTTWLLSAVALLALARARKASA